MFTPKMLRTMRATMDKFLVDILAIYRIGEQSESVFDPVSMTSLPKDADLIYQGKGRVRPTRGPRETVVGESVMVLRDADFSLPWSAPEIHRDDMLKVVESQDAQLSGRWFRITDVVVASQQATRRCSGLQIQPSRLWDTT